MNLSMISTDRFLQTPTFNEKWIALGGTETEKKLLELKLLSSPNTGEIIKGPVPYLRIMDFPIGEDVVRVIKPIYLYVNDEIPLLLLDVAQGVDGFDVSMLDPDAVASFWRNMSQFVDLITQVLS